MFFFFVLFGQAKNKTGSALNLTMILFLDIDGVLHPDPAMAEEGFFQRHLLWQLLSARTELKVVISSDWRTRHSLPELTPDARIISGI